MSGSVYEAVAYAMRYWFVFATCVILIAVIYTSVSEYRQRKNILDEVDSIVGYLEISAGPEDWIGNRVGIRAENTLGRLAKSDICLDDYSIAKSHALLYKKGDDLVISPLGKAETSVNGRLIAGVQVLRTGDTIEIGDIQLKVFIKRTRLQNDY
ncbi:MAG: FHA domain-containing protein [Eubacteriales bacterium]